MKFLRSAQSVGRALRGYAAPAQIIDGITGKPLSGSLRIAANVGICRVCGRTLTNAETIARGVGPKCGGGFKSSLRRKKEKFTIDMFDAEFTYKFRGSLLVIMDLNRGHKSVTNDMENVIHKIRTENPGKIDENTIIIYQDSEGLFDQVKLSRRDKYLEIVFIALQCKTEKEAREKLTLLEAASHE